MKESYNVAVRLYQEAILSGSPANRCHCCGAQVEEGLKGCFETFAHLCNLGYEDAAYSAATFYGVDAHALQHPEIHGKKNNAAHLLRLFWIFEAGAEPYGGVVPQWWQRYLQQPQVPYLEPPKQRGEITVMEVAMHTPETYGTTMKEWALSVFQAWRVHHPWARAALSEIFSNRRRSD